MEITQTELYNSIIEYGAKGTKTKEITQNILKEWRGSQTIKDMLEAQAYLLVKNTTINYKSRSYKDENGLIVVNDNLTNTKSRTAQYRKSVKQKLNFAFAKPFIIRCNDETYKEQWEKFLSVSVRKTIKRTGLNAINKGIGYIYAWINEKGELELVDVIPETIYPAWKDTAHTELDAIVRDFTITEYVNQTAQDVRKVEFWDKETVEKFIDYSMGEGVGGSLVPDIENVDELSNDMKENTTIIQSHLVDGNGNGVGWGRVPFLFFKGNEEELPLLNECRDDIDNYDLLKSKALDGILDDIDAVLVIESIGAEMGELTKARRMVQNSRIVAVDPGGSVKFEKVDANITATSSMLEIIRKDVQDDTNTVDLTTVKLGTNPSGKAMRVFYENLNEWANGFESEFRDFMENLKYFFNMWLAWKGGYGTFEELQAKEITFELNRDLIIDESDIFDNLVKMQDELSQQTKDEMNPWVENHEKEQKRREDDLKRQQKESELFKFNQDLEQHELGYNGDDQNDNLDKQIVNKKPSPEQV